MKIHFSLVIFLFIKYKSVTDLRVAHGVPTPLPKYCDIYIF